MPAQAIELGDLRPFIAPVLLEAVADLRDAALLRRSINEVSDQVRGSGATRRRRIHLTSAIDADEGLFVQAIIYRESGPPAWLAANKLEDELHHLVVVAVRGSVLTICASDGAMRDRIVKKLRCVRRMPRDAIAAFVGPEAKAIWLNGIHTPTASKADTKAMTGVGLEYALDPIGDQTYYYSAARTMPDVAGLRGPANKPVMVGAAPAGARVWIRRSESWQEFKRVLGVVIDHATHGVRPSDPFASLARAVDSAAGVADAYGLSVIPEELLSEDEIPAADREAARRWAFDATFDVAPLAGLSLRVEPHLDGVALGTIDLAVALDDGVTKITTAWVDQAAGMVNECAECARFLGDVDCVKIYYESGHSIAQGRCYAGGYSDQPFGWRFESFAGYAIDREKPVVPRRSTLAAEIAANGDTSLFAYVVEKLFADDAGNPKGWLASDDGSMELADFIHLDPDARTITLVHVKASSKVAPSRLAAPGDYEIVVSQAVKNLRHLDRRNLLHELTRGKGRKIGAAVWHDGVKQPDRDGFLAAAGRLPRATAKILVVLQPRVTRAEMTHCLADGAAPNDAMRMKQINTMMLAARASALACGASFEGIADLG